MGTIIGYIVIGLLGGTIAKAISPGEESRSWVSTMGLGIVGALLGGFLGGLTLNVSYVSIWSLYGLLCSVVGALLILLISRAVGRR